MNRRRSYLFLNAGSVKIAGVGKPSSSAITDNAKRWRSQPDVGIHVESKGDDEHFKMIKFSN